MDGLDIVKPPAPTAPVARDVPGAKSASCCAPASSIQPAGGALRSWIGDRRVLAVAGLAGAGAGLGLGWDWLTAVGVAPLIVSAAPCLIMCALGLCMMRRGHRASSNPPATGAAVPAAPTDPPASP